MLAELCIKLTDMQTENTIQSLVEHTREAINQAEQLKHLDLQELNWRAAFDSWSILECLEHLNLYGNFYLPQIELQIKQSNTKPDPVFKSGILGDYFAKSMLPKEKLNKMKTFKDKNPLNSKLDKAVIDHFIAQQMKLLDLLSQSRNVNLSKVKIKTSISSLIRINLGDTFRFIIYHNLRHLKQIEVIQSRMRT